MRLRRVHALLPVIALVSALCAVAFAQQRDRPTNNRPDKTTISDPFKGPVGGPLYTTTVAGAKTGGGGGGKGKGGGGGGGTTPPDPATATTLVLYDTGGPYGWLGELYAILTANLVSHFGTWTAVPIVRYTPGQLESFTAAIYIGSTYDEPIPLAFLDDVLRTAKPVTWIGYNIWQLTNYHQVLNPGTTFAEAYGWMPGVLDYSPIETVRYKSTNLNRYRPNGAGIMTYNYLANGVELAAAVRDDGSTFPWAVRSRALTYVGENPFVYVEEGDRGLIFEDLLFDALAPDRPERHRALVRLEDIAPTADPARLRAIADYLHKEGVPFSFGVIPVYTDPGGVYSGGVPTTVKLSNAAAAPVVEALRYMQQKGGVMINHGWTHQYAAVPNPYNGVSADDFEFYRIRENEDKTLSWIGPVAEDTSEKWTQDRLNRSAQEFLAAGFTPPAIFEFPHYSASVNGYRAVARMFTTRYERTLYFRGLLSGTIDHTRLAGQRFSYVVRDVYGTKVLPENLGAIEPEPFYQFPMRLPHEIVADAYRVKVIRDGFASFYFHPFWHISYLKETVAGIKQAGFTFVSPAGL
ncbi:polysaccharide deacetylase family protein [soil metagenome]